MNQLNFDFTDLKMDNLNRLVAACKICLADKKPELENIRGKYNEQLKVKGSFLDIVKATVKDADSKVNKKEKGEKP